MPDYNLKGKVAIVTGSSSGIGRGTVLALAAEGAWVTVTGRDEVALRQVEQKCKELAGPQAKVLVLVADLSKEDDCERVVADTVKHFGRLDILVNNAGVAVPGGIEMLSLEQYDHQMNINTRAVFHLTKLALPHLLLTKGNIVNVSSLSSIRPLLNVVAYNMSKAAMDHLTRSVALEVGGRGVRVNAVNPGLIVTEIHKRAGMSEQGYKEHVEHGKSLHALGRVGEVEEVADAILFLASDRASFITGVTLSVDGGRNVMCPH